MPSTVKVRVKEAKNLPVMDNHTKLASAVGSVVAGGVGGGLSSLRSATTAAATAVTTGSTVGSNNNSTSNTPSTDAYVLVTLGGHYSLTDSREEEDGSTRIGGP